MGNYAFMTRDPIPDVLDGHVFTGDNFIQKVPNTQILVGKNKLKFINCNLTNCKLPADAIVEGTFVVQKSFCSHIHPRWGLAECVENCEHVVDIDEIVIDGIIIDIVYRYAAKAMV